MAKVIKVKAEFQDGVSGNTKKMAGSVKSSFDKTAKSSGKLAAGFKKVAVAAVGLFALSKVNNFLKSTISLFDIQILAETKLAVALGFTSEKLLDQASALQKVTKFGDEQTIEAGALLATYGLQEEAISKLIPLLLDMSAATGMDLAGAADLAGKSLGSTTNALSRYGIMIEGAVGSSERLDSAVLALTGRFEGQAEAAAEVGSGPLVQLGNAYGDVKERIGEAITESSIFKSGVSALSGVIRFLDRALGGAKEEMDEFTKSLDQAARASKGLAEELAEQAIQFKTDAEAESDFIKQRDKALKKAQEEQLATRNSIGLAKELGLTRAEVDALTDKQLEKRLKTMEKAFEVEKEQAQKSNEARSLELTALSTFETQRKTDADAVRDEDNAALDEHFATKKAREEQALLDTKTIASKNKAITLAAASEIGAFTDAISSGIGKGAEGFKQSLKATMITLLSFVERLIIVQQAAALAKSGINILQAPAELGKLIATKAAFSIAKASVNSFQSGTVGAPGGPSIINEGGPEIVELPRGARVFNANETNNITGDKVININTTVSSEEIIGALMQAEHDGKLHDFKVKLADDILA